MTRAQSTRSCLWRRARCPSGFVETPDERMVVLEQDEFLEQNKYPDFTLRDDFCDAKQQPRRTET